MNQSKIEAIGKRSAENIQALFTEHAEQLAEGIAAAAEEAQAQGKEKLSITIGHSIKLDLGEDSQTDTLTWSVKHKVEAVSRIPDPSQPELPLKSGASLTMKTGETVVTVGTPAELVEKIEKVLAKKGAKGEPATT